MSFEWALPEEYAAVVRSGIFDADWYLERNPEVPRSHADALTHFMEIGWREGRDPSPHFSSSFYLRHYPDVRAAERNPLAHYVTVGWTEGRLPSADFVPPAEADQVPGVNPLTVRLALEWAWSAGPYAGPIAPDGTGLPSLADRAELPANRQPAACPLRTVAFYLPQFHRIPENDEWWGEGFTEWTNVRRGTPKFEGHYQPHVPGDLGYYDLDDPMVMRQQVLMARNHGVTAFCFYVYWFGGKRLLEKPVDAFLADPQLDQEFLVCWANENWTRTWDGEESAVLMSQSYKEADDVRFIRDMAPYLRDPRYVRVHGRPLLLVYRPGEMPDPAATARRWRSWCRANGIGEIALAYVQAFEHPDPRKIGFDYAIEFPPNQSDPPDVTGTVRFFEEFQGKVYDWTSLVERSRSYSSPGYPLFRGVCPSWDNNARRPSGGSILVGSAPDLFRDWLINAGQDTIERYSDPDERLVFINAWNEWAEGCHLEPDERFGYQWLHAVRDAQQVLGADDALAPPGVVVVTHDLHPHGAQMLALEIGRMLADLGLRVEFVSLGSGSMADEYRACAPLHVMEGAAPEDLAELADRLTFAGFTTVIANTTISAPAAEAFAEAGCTVVGLVHELPRILEAMGATPAASVLARSADRVVFAADHVRDSYPALEFVRDAVVRPQGLYRLPPEGVTVGDEALRRSVRAELGIPSESHVLLAVGFGDRRKGLDLLAGLVESGLHQHRGRPVHFVWLGRVDVYDQDLMAAASRATETGHLHIVDFTDDVYRYYAASDILALVSREDPYPSVTLEAAAVGLLPLGVQGHTGQDDLIKRLGGVLATSDSLPALTKAVERALQAALAQTANDVNQRIAHMIGSSSMRQYVMDLLAGTPAEIARVTAVIPNYNYAQLISDRIAQVDAQTHPVYELIVLDDASGDDSSEAIRVALTKVRLPARFIANDANSGSVYRQWEKGIAEANGEFVWIAEADDMADRDFLEEVIGAFEDPGVVLSFCESRMLDEEGVETAPDYTSYTATISSRDYSRRYLQRGDREIAECLTVGNSIPNVSAVVFRRQAALQAFSADERRGDFPTSADWLFYIELLKTGDVAFESRALNSHRRHSASVIGRSLGRDHLLEILRLMRVAEASCGEPRLPSDLLHRRQRTVEHLVGYLGLDPAALLADHDIQAAMRVLGLSTVDKARRDDNWGFGSSSG